ncbi:hypothetical protein CLOP_g8849, partial [Closterium sp. NIES-67]
MPLRLSRCRVAHMLLRAPFHRSPRALAAPPRNCASSPTASHGPVARSPQTSSATPAIGHCIATSNRRRTVACALRAALAPAAPRPRCCAPALAAVCPPSLAPAASSPLRARAFSAAGAGAEGVGRADGGARDGSAMGRRLVLGAAAGARRERRGFGGIASAGHGEVARAAMAEGAVLRGGEAGGARGMGVMEGAAGVAGVARRGVVHARWGGGEGAEGQRAVVLWDLDNVQPERAEPFDAALRLRDLAASFGSPVDVLAYANRHAFDFVPAWVREERRARREEERLEAQGLLQRAEPLTCQLCGRRCSSAAALRKHFVSLHKREHEKRLQHLKHASPKRQRRLREVYRGKQQRYQEAVRGVVQPKRGYGLMPELRRAGVVVRLVSQQSQ